MIETFKIMKNYNEEVTPVIKLNPSTTRGSSLKLSKLRANKT